MSGPGSGRKKGSASKSMSRRDPTTARKIKANKLQDKEYARQKSNTGGTAAGRGYKLPKGYKPRPQ